jgi:probable phosphoglycerate mutase
VIELVLIRHGPTAENASGRLTGRADPPLSNAGRDAVRDWRIPEAWVGHEWVTSPLRRTRETAAILGRGDARVEPALVEMDWGRWEGFSLAELRADAGAGFSTAEALGLDLQPPGGESPRRVQARIGPWLDRLERSTVAVTHKGVIRALVALATGWDMVAKSPCKWRPSAAQVLARGPDGRWSLAVADLSLTHGSVHAG